MNPGLVSLWSFLLQTIQGKLCFSDFTLKKTAVARWPRNPEAPCSDPCRVRKGIRHKTLAKSFMLAHSQWQPLKKGAAGKKTTTIKNQVFLIIKNVKNLFFKKEKKSPTHFGNYFEWSLELGVVAQGLENVGQ